MEDTTQENTILPENEMPQDGDLPKLPIAKLTVQTLFWAIVAGMLIVVLTLSLFPYEAMKLYAGWGLSDRALTAAEQYVRRSEKDWQDVNPPADSRFADALLLAVNNSIGLTTERLQKGGFADDKAKYYAQKTDTYVTKYQKYNTAGSLGGRTDRIDAYSRRTAPPEMHPWLSVYSFTDYILVMQYRANLLLDKQDALYRKHVDDTMSTWDADNWHVPAMGAELNNIFVLFSQLNQYLKMELGKLGFYDLTPDNGEFYSKAEVAQKIRYVGKIDRPFGYFIEDSGEFTRLFQLLNRRFDAFKDFLVQETDRTSVDKMLPYVYYANVLSQLAQSINNMCLVVSCNTDAYNGTYTDILTNLYDDWLADRYTVRGTTVSTGNGNETITNPYLSDYYKFGQLREYVQLYNR